MRFAAGLGQPVASAEEYYQQADQIAETGAAPTNEDWMPLGVFAVVADESPPLLP